MATPTLATVGGLSYSVGYQGEIANDPLNADIESRTNENATAIDYGAAVCRGVAATPGVNGNCRPIFNPGVVVGFAVRQLSEANALVAGSPTINIPQNSQVGVLKDGWMWGLCGENATEGDAVVAVVADPTRLGSNTGGAANATTRLATGAVWMQTVTVGNVGLIRVKNVA